MKSLLEAVFAQYIEIGEPPAYADLIEYLRETDELLGEDRIQIHTYLRNRCLDTRIARGQPGDVCLDKVYSTPVSPNPCAFGGESDDQSEVDEQLTPESTEEDVIK